MRGNDLIYFNETIQKALSNKISVRLVNSKSYKEGESYISGSFDGSELICCTRSSYKKWFPVFVHESCHMDQSLEESELWRKTNSVIDIFSWIDNKNINYSDIELDSAFEAYRELELDCELRVIQKIKTYGLSLDIKKYTKEANCYVLFYNFMRKYRVWYKKNKSIYTSKKVIEFMSDKFEYDYTKLPNIYEKLVLSECFDNKITPYRNK